MKITATTASSAGNDSNRIEGSKNSLCFSYLKENEYDDDNNNESKSNEKNNTSSSNSSNGGKSNNNNISSNTINSQYTLSPFSASPASSDSTTAQYMTTTTTKTTIKKTKGGGQSPSSLAPFEKLLQKRKSTLNRRPYPVSPSRSQQTKKENKTKKEILLQSNITAMNKNVNVKFRKRNLSFYERSQLHLAAKDQKIQLLREQVYQDCTFRPNINRYPLRKQKQQQQKYEQQQQQKKQQQQQQQQHMLRLPLSPSSLSFGDKENMFPGRLERSKSQHHSNLTPSTATASSASRTPTTVHCKPVLHQTSSGEVSAASRAMSSIAASSSRVEELYQDGLQRARRRPASVQEEKEVRTKRYEEKELEKCTFRPKLKWGSKLQRKNEHIVNNYKNDYVHRRRDIGKTIGEKSNNKAKNKTKSPMRDQHNASTAFTQHHKQQLQEHVPLPLEIITTTTTRTTTTATNPKLIVTSIPSTTTTMTTTAGNAFNNATDAESIDSDKKIISYFRRKQRESLKSVKNCFKHDKNFADNAGGKNNETKNKEEEIDLWYTFKDQFSEPLSPLIDSDLPQEASNNVAMMLSPSLCSSVSDDDDEDERFPTPRVIFCSATVGERSQRTEYGSI